MQLSIDILTYFCSVTIKAVLFEPLRQVGGGYFKTLLLPGGNLTHLPFIISITDTVTARLSS